MFFIKCLHAFRLKDKPPVSYKEQRIPKTDKKSTDDVDINIGEGENPEFYTEEHEKLLGDCQNAWILYVDGYGEDGQRIYDPNNGTSCHQCRSKHLFSPSVLCCLIAYFFLKVLINSRHRKPLHL